MHPDTEIAKVRDRPNIDKELLWADLNYDEEVVEVVTSYHHRIDNILLGSVVRQLISGLLAALAFYMMLVTAGSAFYITLLCHYALAITFTQIFLENKHRERDMKKALVTRNNELRRLYQEENNT